MLQKMFNTNLIQAYEACKSALRDYRCEEVYGDYAAGVIEALKRSKFHDEEKIMIRVDSGSNVIISISVNSNTDTSNLWNLELNKLQEAVVLDLISVKLS